MVEDKVMVNLETEDVPTGLTRPFFSIVIAAYNSEKTIEYTLKSISEQSIDKAEVEVLVIDGGSQDETVNIAKKYGARIFNNEKKLPEYAKAIGNKEALGHFVLRMDSDEEFSYKQQLEDKMHFLQKNPEIKVLISNCCVAGRKEITGISADYMNILGDPFSYFVYKTKKDKSTTYRNNIVNNDGKCVVMRFKEGDVYPLADSATCGVCLDYIREQYPNEYCSIEFICNTYDRVIAQTEYCGVIIDDVIKHNCSSSLKTYLSKLKFRVINNLFHKDESGFSAKEYVSENLSKRKMLFCLYALCVPLVILDSIRLAVVYKNVTFMLHFIYLYYVCIQVLWYGAVKLFGGTRRNKSYAK